MNSLARERKRKLDTKIIHSLDKGLEVMELVAGADGDTGLSELAQQLKWDKSTVFRLLTTLIRRGYVEQDSQTKRYRLGFRILHLEHQLFKSLDLPRVSRDILTRLALDTGEAAHLAALEREHCVIVAQRESPERIAVNSHIGMAEPLHCTALGKAILMQLGEASLKRIVSTLELKAYTRNTITSVEWLLKHIEKCRSSGYALDEEEFDEGVRCVGAPVHVPGSRQLYSMGISGPSSRVVAGRLGALVEHVLEATKELSRLLGGNCLQVESK